MFFLFSPPRSRTPVASGPSTFMIEPRRSSVDSVTVVPPRPLGSKVYRHKAIFSPNDLLSQATSLAGLAVTMWATVDQRRHPRRLRDLKRAPSVAPVAPPTHLPPWFSGLHSPMRLRSDTIP